MKVIGIDPGYAATGYGVVERVSGRLRAVAFGALRTPAGEPHAVRLAELRARFVELVEDHRPQAVAIERVLFNANVRTAMLVGQASGVVLATAAERGLAVTEYTPGEVKQAVSGVGNAPKKQVQSMVGALLGLDVPPHPADAADALALAICHLHQGGLRRAILGAER